MTITAILAFITFFAVVVSSVQVYLVRRFMSREERRASEADAFSPVVSILKPLCGLEDGLEENIASFARLKGVDYEVVFSVADPGDPAIAVYERVRALNPDAPFILVTGDASSSEIANPKVERLVAAERVARGDILFVSDANVRVSPGDIAGSTDLFRDPGVGCVSNLFVASGASSPGALLESAHILTFVVAGNVLAYSGGVACVVGKSMGIRRETLERLGGFEAFGRYLGEDQTLGLAAARAGYRLEMPPLVVRNVVRNRSIGWAIARQVRWNKIRYSYSKLTYVSEFLINPLPPAILTALVGLMHSTAWSLLLLVGAVALLRVGHAHLLNVATGSHSPVAAILIAPFQDLIQFFAQLAPYFSSEVNWRGHRARLGPGSVIRPVISAEGGLESEPLGGVEA